MKKNAVSFRVLGLYFAVLMLCAFALTGCGASKEMSAMTEAAAPAAEERGSGQYLYDNAMPTEEIMAEEAVEEVLPEEEMAEERDASEALSDRKLITTMNISAETEELDILMYNVETMVSELGGYMENTEIWNGSAYSGHRSRSAYLVIRVPAEHLSAFVNRIAEDSNIVSQSKSVEDVTLSYVDLESHKFALETEQKRLLELLEMAETMEDILAIEDKLGEVRYELESMESQLRTYDNKINYSTVYLDVQEIEQYEPYVAKSTGERIREGFMRNVHKVTDGMKEFFIELVIALPIILVACVIIGIGIAILVFLVKRSEKHAAKRRQIRAQQYDAQKAGRQQSPALRYRTPENTAYSETSDASENGAEKEKGSENS